MIGKKRVRRKVFNMNKVIEGFVISNSIEEISALIKSVYPDWNESAEVNGADYNDEYIIWGCQLEIIIPYDTIRDIEVDKTALVVRTLKHKMRTLQVLQVCGNEYAIFAFVPSMSPTWQIVPGSIRPTEREAASYLAFCCSDESGLD